MGLLAGACGGGSDSGSTSAAASPTTESTTAPQGGDSTAEGAGASEPGDSTGEGGGKSGDGRGTGDSSGGGSASKGGSKAGGSSEGGGSSSKSGGGASSSNSAAKAKLIREGDAICRQAKKEQIRSVQEFIKTQNPEVSGKAAIEELTLKAGLPPIKHAIRELKGLQPPADVAAEFAAIVSGLERALAEAEADPSTVIADAKGPFDAPNRLAREFGFRACGGMA